MSDQGAPDQRGAPLAHEPFHEVIGPAQATGHLGPAPATAVNVGVGVGFTVAPSAFPSGADLEVMERLHPGAMGRILTMGEAAQQAQIQATKDALDNGRGDMKRGQMLGAGLTALSIVSAALVGYAGDTVVAVAILGVPVFTAVRAVIESAKK